MAGIGISVQISNRELSGALSKFVADLAQDVETEARAHTPIRTGNARRNWTKTVTNKSFEVKNQVPYIGKLEAGASRQAPKGIIGPTLTTIKGKYR